MTNPERSSRVFVTALDDQLLLHDAATQQTHCLNPLARRVWELCDGTRDRDAIVRALAAEGVVHAEDVTDAALDSFVEQELLVSNGFDRRTVGAGIAKAVAAGLVISVLAPGRAAAASTADCSIHTNSIDCGNDPCCIWLIDTCVPAA